ATAMAVAPPAPPTASTANTAQDRAPPTPASVRGATRAPATTVVEPDRGHDDVASPRPTVAVSAGIAEGLALIRARQEPLRAGSGTRRRARMDERDRRFPDGALAEERDAARVLALSQLGRTADACVNAARFVEAHPLSPQASTVRAACSRGH